MNLAGPLSQHVKSGRLGVVCGAETGFVLATNPDTVLAPDIAFVRRTRFRRQAAPGPSGTALRTWRWRFCRPATHTPRSPTR